MRRTAQSGTSRGTLENIPAVRISELVHPTEYPLTHATRFFYKKHYDLSLDSGRLCLGLTQIVSEIAKKFDPNLSQSPKGVLIKKRVN